MAEGRTVTAVNDHCDRRLDALSLYVAEGSNDEDAMRAIFGSVQPSDLLCGLLGLFGSALAGWADAADVDRETLINQLRADAVRIRDLYR
jgi:hypothetical protein